MQILQKTEYPHLAFSGPRKPRSVSAGSSGGTTQPERKLREEFPFLASPDCPVELKALVTDRITAYHRYRQLYPQLFQATTPEESARTAGDLVRAYIDNRRIWEELSYYQEHHRLLGRHPVFRHYANLRQLRAMNVRQLLRREQQVKDNLWRVRNEMKKADRPDLDQQRRDRITIYEAELAEIRRCLGEE